MVVTGLQYIYERVLPAVWRHPLSWPFQKPVDAEKLNIPDYPQIIQHPMDLSTIREKLEANMYNSTDECIEDFNQMFQNCHVYNSPGQEIMMMCETLEVVFQQEIAAMPHGV